MKFLEQMTVTAWLLYVLAVLLSSLVMILGLTADMPVAGTIGFACDFGLLFAFFLIALGPVEDK